MSKMNSRSVCVEWSIIFKHTDTHTHLHTDTHTHMRVCAPIALDFINTCNEIVVDYGIYSYSSIKPHIIHAGTMYTHTRRWQHTSRHSITLQIHLSAAKSLYETTKVFCCLAILCTKCTKKLTTKLLLHSHVCVLATTVATFTY